MAALTATTPTRVGALSAGAAVASTDTISRAVIGSRGAYLEIINGNANPDTVTVSDPGLTPAGSPLADGTYSVTVTNATSKILFISPSQITPSTGLVTITHSVTTTVTYKLYPIDR